MRYKIIIEDPNFDPLFLDAGEDGNGKVELEPVFCSEKSAQKYIDKQYRVRLWYFYRKFIFTVVKE